MCDYSLEFYRTRPAREGERYITTRFRSGTIGLAAEDNRSIPICVPCSATLFLEGLPKHVQDETGEGESARVTFVEISSGAFRDGIRFADGTVMSLQKLGPGVRAQVIDALTGSIEVKPAETNAV